MALNPILDGQLEFMKRGGPLQMGLRHLRDRGILIEEDAYQHQEYPKMLSTPGNPVVASEEEEERVLSGGMTSAQLEDERQGLLQRCRTMRITADPSWSMIRLRRELGEVLDAPVAAGDRMASLEAELAYERKIAAMEEEIAALRARKAEGNEAEEMRAQLADLGVKADGRWSIAKLREELNRHTSPHGA
jgi:hypothetical protein